MQRGWTVGTMIVAGLCSCGDNGGRPDDDSTGAGLTTTGVGTGATTTAGSTTAGSTTDLPTTGGSGSAAETTTGTDPSTGSATTAATSSTGEASSTGVGACMNCDEPNQACVADECVTLCQGQDPSPCAADELCDVITGMCKPAGADCTLAGGSLPCGDRSCGPGSVCDDQGTCLPIAPCADVACTTEGACWGALCVCERPIACSDPTIEALNGPFADKIIGLDFADDCTAWMVTLRDGVDYLRRLLPNGELSEWPGVSNLDMGEVKVLRSLTVPQLTTLPPLADHYTPPTPAEGLGEVALTYTCIGGCDGNDPQGVARLVEEDPNNPLPLVIIAAVTTGLGPFEVPVADAGPQGLSWGVDRVLYVG